MPESPEVRIFVENLSKYKHSNLLNINFLSGRYKHHQLPLNFKEFQKLFPLKLSNIHNKGKFIYFVFDDYSIWITLGLSGYFTTIKDSHSHIEFITDKGIFYFNDVRNFGTINFCLDKQELEKKLNKLGIDVLDEEISDEIYIKKMRKVNQNKIIGEVLVEQNIISGIGNYLRAEILYKVKISPFRKLKDLSNIELSKLKKNIIKIITQSYHKQLNDGLHSNIVHVYLKDKTDKDEIVEHSKDKHNRTIWWVPSVQK